MTILRAAMLCLVLVLAASLGFCDTVVFEEHFSDPFVVHDWVYNNSGNSGADGYPGGQPTQPWPGMISEDGHELLGYYPTTYYATSFETFITTSINNQDGWNGTGYIAQGGHGTDEKSARFVSQSAYRTVTAGMQGDVQYVQCYVKCASPSQEARVHAGAGDPASAAAAVVRFSSTGKIEALDGDGSGGGAWIELASYLPDTWYRISLRIDYSTYRYRAAVNGGYNDSDLGFRDPGAGTLGSIGFQQIGGTTLYVDDVYAGNSPYAPGFDGQDRILPYWSDTYNHDCINYGQAIYGTNDIYDWMSCSDLTANPVNTDPTRAPVYKASLPDGWTAAFGMQADQEPQDYYASGRAKTGFTRLMGSYAQTPVNPCLHIWSSHGDLRVASPNISAGPGVYTLAWRGGVWNLNTADPDQQYKWSDHCSWGFGYTNWCVWDEWHPNEPYIQTIPPYPKSQDGIGVTDFWAWPYEPFHLVNPDGDINPDWRPAGPHPAGEEPGMWHTYQNEFAFGMPPDKDGVVYPFRSDPGCFIGFRVGHSHDENQDAGNWRWGTILNVDDIVLTRKDPVPIPNVRDLPVGSLVEIDNLVVANMILAPAPPPDYYNRVEVFLEKKDRSAGIVLRARGDAVPAFWDNLAGQFKFERGDVVKIVGAVSKMNPKPDPPMGDEDNPVRYIAEGPAGWRLPAMIKTGEPQETLRPVALSQRALVGDPNNPRQASDGMLVTVFGRVNHSYYYPFWPSYFFVDDGTHLPAGDLEEFPGQEAVGVKIDCRGLINDYAWPGCPGDDSYVAVTGTFTLELNLSNEPIGVVYPRVATDIVPIWE